MVTLLVTIHAIASVIGFLSIILFMIQPPSYYQKVLTMTATCSFLGLVGYLLELLADSLDEALVAVRVGYIGKCYAMVLFLLFIQKYCDVEISKKWLYPILAFDTFVLILIFTFPWHHLYYTSWEYVYDGDFGHLVLGKGIFYYLFMIVTLGVMLRFVYISFTTMRQRSGKQRSRLALLFASGLVPGVALVLNLSPALKGIDPTPMGVLISTMLAGLNVLRYGLLDTLQLASKSVMDASSAGLVVVGSTKKFLFANQTAYKTFDELADKKIADEFVWSLFEGVGSKSDNPKKTFQKNGNIYELDFSTLNESAIKSENGNGGYMVWIFDKTKDYKYTQELEKIRKKAEEANIAKSMFLAKMSHEIRTPMNGIIGFTQLIREQNIDDTTKEYLGYIDSSSHALLGIINDILDISKIESGKMDIVNIEYSVDDLFKDICMMIKNQAEAKGLTFESDIKPGIPQMLYGDYTRFREILVNILGNAVKYTFDGEVSFNVDYKINDDIIVFDIHIKDTGVGIKPEKIASIFDSFEQADSLGNYNVEGTGLGLSIAKQLAELMGGDISVVSEYGNGSDFNIKLTQKISKTKYVEKIEINKNVSYKNVRILLVDDNEINLKVESNILKKLGIEVDMVNSGLKCISIAEKEKYDVIFMDHMMPDMDGVETMKRLKADSVVNSDTPIIVVTANAIVGVNKELMDLGFDGYISKPIDKKALNEQLARVLPEEKIVFYEEQGEESKELSLEEQIQEMLDDVEINVSQALEYCGEIEDYLDILEIISSTTEDKIKNLNAFKEKEDWENYTILVHALKSGLNNIGAASSGNLARELEMAGKENRIDYILDNHDYFIKTYSAVNDSVVEVLKKFKPDFTIENTISEGKIVGESAIVEVHSDKKTDSEVSFGDELDKDLLKEMVDSINFYIDELEAEKAMKILDGLNNFSFDEADREKIEVASNALHVYNMELAKSVVQQLLH